MAGTGAIPKLLTKNVASAGTAERISATPNENFKYALIQAKKGNAGDIYIGDPTVDSSTGLAVPSYNSVPLKVYVDLYNLWIDADTSTEGINILTFD